MEKSTNNYKKKEINYDFLRVLCTIIVLAIHVGTSYRSFYDDSDAPYKIHFVFTLITDTFFKFIIPCFVMLSGAFLLDNDDNKNYQLFYKKSFKKIFIPTIIFSIFYFICSELMACFDFFKTHDYNNLIAPAIEFAKGRPFYHMWYLYALIGIYILVPVIVRIKIDIGEENFKKVSWILFIICIISGISSTGEIFWSISKAVLYIGFLVAGYQIRKNFKKNNIACIISFVVAFMLLSSLLYIQCFCVETGILKEEFFTSSFNPIVAISALLIFYGFSCLKIKSKVISRLSKYTFLIYLIHAGVCAFIILAFKIIGVVPDPIYTIPICIIVVTVLSYFLSLLYEKIFNYLDKKYSISDKMLGIVKRIYKKI